MEIKYLVRNVRIEKGMSLGELSRLSGIPKTTLSDIENNKVSPSFISIYKISLALKVSIYELFTGVR